MRDPELADPSSPPAAPSAVDCVPLWSLGLGVVTTAATLAWLGLRRLPGAGAVLMAFVVLAALGVTLGVCGVLLALRDGRRLSCALAGTGLNLCLPGVLLAGGPEGLLRG
jgi:hypothetical protein